MIVTFVHKDIFFGGNDEPNIRRKCREFKLFVRIEAVV